MNVYLLCSAHLDPVWQWNWDEGAAEAISTFRCAADFCEKFDGFVFNHNEALLYQFIEKFDPELFKRIELLIKKGKWIVMGGWYLQPDCNLPNGESIISQIEIGQEYFKEKFGIKPKIAVNIDSFGHSRGLVQILKKSGYDGYLFMRPMEGQIELPNNEFIWQGYDDSDMVAMRYPTWYNTSLGQSVERINELIENNPKDKNNLLVLWGMGDHGGGPSKKDIEEIDVFANNAKEKGINIIHSDIQTYFDTIQKELLPKYDLSLHHSMPGCYSSMSRIKRAHRELENELFITKSICSIANYNKGFEYPKAKIKESTIDLCFSEFHDLLPGTSIEDVEKSGLDIISHGKKILSELKLSAFISLCKNQKVADAETIPIFAYNPFPYMIDTEIECEFMLQNQNHNDEEVWIAQVYNENGEEVKTQHEKEKSNINLDWRKKVVFSAKLNPSTITRFDCKLSTIPIDYREDDWRGMPNQVSFEGIHDDIIFTSDNASITVSPNGIVSSWVVGGKELVSAPLGKFALYNDTPDPWGMEEFDFTGKVKNEFVLASPDEAGEICGFNHPIPPVRIIESGNVRTVIESIWVSGRSYIVSKCIVPNHLRYVDTEYNIFMADKDSMLKTIFTPKLGNDKVFTAEDMFGNRVINEIGKEQPIHKWVALSDDENYLSIINSGQYAADCFEDSIRLTILRTPAYCAHPSDGGATIPQNRYLPRMDQGEHFVSLRIVADKKDSYSKLTNSAAVFNVKPYVLSFFPDGSENIKLNNIIIDDETIQLTNFETKDSGYLIRLFNPNCSKRKFKISCFSVEKEVALEKYSFKTFIYREGVITESNIFGEM